MNERDIFLEALRRESPHERGLFLAECCGSDAALRRRIEQLLLSHDCGGGFLQAVAGSDDDTMPQQARESLSPAAGEDSNSTPLQPPLAADTALDFLEPCDTPGRLGTLGPYEISEVIGRGGMGLVLRGHDARLNRVVAIKVLAPHLASNPTAHRRFLREAQAAAAVSHPHVVTIHAIGEAGQMPYLVMEYVTGQSLQQKLEQQGALGLAEVLRIGSQVAAGLAAAHAQGLIHRDIKPPNILLQDGLERVKITDFGLARAVDDISDTQTGRVAGTPQYMSPEQAAGDTIDHRSDLFSLGSVLYSMCAGRPAFRADSPIAVLRRVMDDTPRSIREINPNVPQWLVMIVDRLLAKRPEQRFQSAQEVADLLNRCLAHVQQPDLMPLPAMGKGWRPVGRARAAGRLRVWGLAIAALLLALAAWGGAQAVRVVYQRQTASNAPRRPSEPASDPTVADQPSPTASAAAKLAPLTGRAQRIVTGGFHSSWSPDSRRIVFTRQDESALEIYDFETQQRRILVSAAEVFTDSSVVDAVFSADGAYVAFGKRPRHPVTDRHLEEEIWLVAADGGQVRRLVSGGYPSWADDPEVLYFHHRGPGLLQSLRLDAAMQPQTLVPSRGLYPVVSPDGRFAAWGEGNRLQIADLASGVTATEWVCPEPAGGMIVAWSPDASELSVSAYTSQRLGFWIFDRASRQAVRITDGPASDARWSLDGRWFSFDTYAPQATIWVLARDPQQPTAQWLRSMWSDQER